MGIFSALGGIAGSIFGGPVGGAIGGGVGGLIDAGTAGDGGAGKSRALQRKSVDGQKEEINSNYNLGQKFLRPYESQDNQAAKQYSNLLMNPNAETSVFQQTPGFKFAIQQGTNAIQNSAAAKGGLVSGAALKGLQTFGQGTAQQYYSDYMNRLQGLQGQGQNLAINNADRAMDRAKLINGQTAAYYGTAMDASQQQAKAQQSNMGQAGGALSMLSGPLSGLFGGGGMNMGQLSGASFGLPGAAGGGSYGMPAGLSSGSNFSVGSGAIM